MNADALMPGVGSSCICSLYVYCFNNPINLLDISGKWPTLLKNFWDGCKAFFKSLNVDVGVGIGVGGKGQLHGIGKIASEASVDFVNIELENGKFNLYTEASAELGFEFSLDRGLFFGASCSHDYFGQCGHKTIPIIDLYSCECIEPEYEYSATFNAIGIENDDLVIGAGYSKYWGIGGSVDVKFNISEFIRLVGM